MRFPYIGKIEDWLYALLFSLLISVPLSFAHDIAWERALCYVFALMSTIIISMRIAMQRLW